MTDRALLLRVAQLLSDLDIPYMIIGGQAVIYHGNPRVTLDVDAVIGAERSVVPKIVDAAVREGLALPPVDPEEFVRRTAVLVLNDPTSRSHVDIVFGFTPYELGAIGRAVKAVVQGQNVCYASAEDLILHKLFASRPQDLIDVRGILLRQRGNLDLEYIREWLPQLAEVSDSPEIVRDFETMVKRYYEGADE